MRGEDEKQLAFLGPVGTYSHQAVIQAFNTRESDNQLLPQTSIYDCFRAVLDDEADFAVVPFENSTNGSVNFTLDILRDLYHKDVEDHGKFDEAMGIAGEEFVDINHCLLTHASGLDRIQRVYSHPQVWGQCDMWYHNNLRGVEKLDVSSTSKAVEMVKNDPTSAAIAGMSAGDVHNVPVLEANISNSKTNQTRFLIFSSPRLTSYKEKMYHGKEYNTFLSFTVEHDMPGALCKALEVFARQNVNIWSIASRPRPLGERPWTYVYFIETHGHETGSALRTALEDMQKYCLQVKVIGSFKRNRLD